MHVYNRSQGLGKLLGNIASSIRAARAAKHHHHHPRRDEEVLAYLMKTFGYGLLTAIVSFTVGAAHFYLTEEVVHLPQATTVVSVDRSSSKGEEERQWTPSVAFTVVALLLVLLYVAFFYWLLRHGRRRGVRIYHYIHKLGVIK